MRWGSAVTLESKGRLSTLVNEEVAVLRRSVKRTLIMMARLPVDDDDVGERGRSPGLQCCRHGVVKDNICQEKL